MVVLHEGSKVGTCINRRIAGIVVTQKECEQQFKKNGDTKEGVEKTIKLPNEHSKERTEKVMESPALQRILEIKAETSEIEREFKRMQEQYTSRMERCKELRVEIEGKQREVQHKFHEATALMKENDARKESAEATTEMEQQKLHKIKRDLEQLHARRDYVVVQAKKIKDERNRLSVYGKFLERVVTESQQEFLEVPDILNRFSTLRRVKRDLLVQYKEQDEVLERKRLQIQQYRQRKKNEILIQNSLLSERQGKLEEVRGGLKVIQDEYEQERGRVKSINCESGQLVAAIRHLHSRCKQMTRIKAVDTFEPDDNIMTHLRQYLKLVSERIQDLTDINMMANRAVVNQERDR